jgi:hypothetical protein
MWKTHQEETQGFFAENPDLAFLIMKEMVERREQDLSDDLPASKSLQSILGEKLLTPNLVERPPPLFPLGPEEIFVHPGRPRRYPRQMPY